jgi:hypothetical protein
MDFYEIVEAQIRGLLHIWKKCLPFNDMHFTVSVVNSAGMQLYSHSDTWEHRPLVGAAVRANYIEYSIISNKTDFEDELISSAIIRMVHCFGLDLKNIWDNQKKPLLPEYYRSF